MEYQVKGPHVVKLAKWEIRALHELGPGEYTIEKISAKAAGMKRHWWGRLYYVVKYPNFSEKR